MFTLERPTMEPTHFVPIVRPRPGTAARVLITGEVRWSMTHFYSGRTWPCTLHSCVLCSHSIPRRLYAFLPCLLPNHVQAILQLTAQAYNQLEKQFRPFADVPLGVAKVSRVGKAKNAPLKVEWSEPNEECRQLAKHAPELDVAAEMLRIWGIPERNGDACEEEYLRRVASFVATTAGLSSADDRIAGNGS
jgi:hypothetical protein